MLLAPSPFGEAGIIRLMLTLSVAAPTAFVELASTKSRGGEAVGTTKCRLEEADSCFQQLFNHMPVCSSAGLTFRCHHFNVLDQCFRDHDIMCLPSAVGQTAKAVYRRRLAECAKEASKKQRQAPLHPQRNSNHWYNRGATSRFTAAPNELQFISLFGYLQSQCRRKELSENGPAGEMTAVMKSRESGEEAANLNEAPGRSSDGSQESSSSSTDQASQQPGCGTQELKELIASCEAQMRQRSPTVRVGSKRKYAVDLDRHQLLRVKLEASSRLLLYTETRRDDECLMIRSGLSDIFPLHQKYCLHATVTRCLCERLHFDQFCAIACDQLEPKGLPFEQTLLWTDFRGRLSGRVSPSSEEYTMGNASGTNAWRWCYGLSGVIVHLLFLLVTLALDSRTTHLH